MTAAAATHGATIRNVETFAAGDYPGDEPGEVWSYGPDDVKQIVRNFATLSSGKCPLHRVPVVVTHDDVNAWGWVNDARLHGDGGNLLTTDWQDVEPTLQRAIKQKRLLKVSPEIKRDFTDKDGKTYPGPYLYRVAVLGADPPRVKGMRDIPRNFKDAKTTKTTTGRRFVASLRFADEGSAMDRTAAIQFLQQKGVDPSLLTDAVPDSVIIGIAMAWQDGDASGGGAAGPSDTREHDDPNSNDDEDDDPTLDDSGNRDQWGNPVSGSRDHDDGDYDNDDDRATELGWEGDPDDDEDLRGFQRFRDRGQGRHRGQRGQRGRKPHPTKVTVTRQFSDRVRRLVENAVGKAMGRQVKKVSEGLKRQQAATRLREIHERQAAVRLFCDQKSKEGRLSPADCDETAPTSVLSRLLRLAAARQQVHRFADPKTRKELTKSELQLQMDEIDAREVRRFSERVRSGAAGATSGGTGAADGDPFRSRCNDYYKRQMDRLPAATGARN